MTRANPGDAPGARTPTTEAAVTTGADVGLVFSQTVRSIQSAMPLRSDDTAVDVEITFRSVTIDSRGIPLFTNRTEQSTMEMKLATRIRPPVASPITH